MEVGMNSSCLLVKHEYISLWTLNVTAKVKTVSFYFT